MIAALSLWLEMFGLGLLDELAAAIASFVKSWLDLPGDMLAVIAYVLGG